MRRLRKSAPANARRAAARKRKAEAAEFEAQRRVLFDRLRNYANECNELDAMRFLGFLRQQRRGYDLKADGASVYMQLVDDIDALDAVEKEWAAKNA